MNKLKKYVKGIQKIFNPYYKLDEALKKSLIDSFANSVHFSFKNIDLTKKGFSLTLDFNREKPMVREIPKKGSFLDYLPESYSVYKRVYQSLYDYIIRFETYVNDKHNQFTKNLEKILGRPLNQLNGAYSLGR